MSEYQHHEFVALVWPFMGEARKLLGQLNKGPADLALRRGPEAHIAVRNPVVNDWEVASGLNAPPRKRRCLSAAGASVTTYGLPLILLCSLSAHGQTLPATKSGLSLQLDSNSQTDSPPLDLADDTELLDFSEDEEWDGQDDKSGVQNEDKLEDDAVTEEGEERIGPVPPLPPEVDRRNEWGLAMASLGGMAGDVVGYLGGVGMLGGYSINYCDDCGARYMGDVILAGVGGMVAAGFLQPAGVLWVGDAFGYNGSYWTTWLGSILGGAFCLAAGYGLYAMDAGWPITTTRGGEANPYVVLPLILGVRALFATSAYYFSDKGAVSTEVRHKDGHGPSTWVSPSLLPGPDGTWFGGVSVLSVW